MTDSPSGLPAEWERELIEAAKHFDWPVVSQVCSSYVKYLRGVPPSSLRVTKQEIKEELQLLRECLRYDDLRAVADAALGQGLDDAVVRRQYAQALADEGNPAAALLIFQGITRDDPAVLESERIEAQGGVGRCYKQLFVLTTESTRRLTYMTRAVDAYLNAYQEDTTRIWHGINAAALLARAAREGASLPGHDDPGSTAQHIAAEILSLVDAMPAPDAWSIATASEALIALDRHDEAVRRGNSFVLAPDVGAFKIASYLRQLLEMWQLNTEEPPGDNLLPVLRSELLKYSGGGVTVESRDVSASRLSFSADQQLEKVLGGDRFHSLTWYRNGLVRCRAVALIEDGNEDGIGTGFLVRGTDLHPDLPPVVLVTNGHVVPERLAVADAVVRFHGLDGDRSQRHAFRCARQWWYQPSERPGLDTMVLELSEHPTTVDPLPLASQLPRLEGTPQRAYLIGHPRGLSQPQFSLQDNLLLDYDETFVHYRSPTEGGSSGSPVFDSQWKLIGLHHSGGFETPRLHNYGGTYSANEAIALTAIRRALATHPPTPQDVG